jgi:quercetin dioxygenase-like cupin family protein
MDSPLGGIKRGRQEIRAAYQQIFASEARATVEFSKIRTSRVFRRNELGGVKVTSVDVRQIDFSRGQQTGRHKHPCPVLGVIIDGTAMVQIERRSAIELCVGSAFYEPADAVMRFDNASPIAPLRFICFYLLNGEQRLIEMLPAKQ